MKAAKILREKIFSGAMTTGILCTEHVWPTLVEICKEAGADYLVVDREHGVHSDELTAHVCQIGRLTDFAVLVRTVSSEASVIRRAVDFGPCGIIIPSVEETAQLDEVRSSIYMPPRGTRRPGGLGNRWMSDYQYETWLNDFEADAIVIPQVETKRGLDNASALANHDVVTALGVGTYDLSASLGYCWKPEEPKLLEAFERLKKVAEDAGKPFWMCTGGRDIVEQGYKFNCMGTPSFLLGAKMREIVKECNDDSPGV